MRTYRNRPLLDLAHRIKECQLRIHGVCQGYSSEGCEPAHSNQYRHGRGIGHKAADVYHAAACHACHTAIDSGKDLSKQEKQMYWQDGFERTLKIYFEQGWVKVSS